MDEADHLKAIGATDVIDRAELSEPGRPLQAERWAAAIDSVGSHTLANVCAQIKWGGAVAACGLAQGMDFPSTVAPFILRGVTLYGVDSVMQPLAMREQAWAALAEIFNEASLAQITEVIPFDQAIPAAHDLLAGKIRGRVAVKIK
jgi:acrylyl-CoA reductase (NADPH)